MEIDWNAPESDISVSLGSMKLGMKLGTRKQELVLSLLSFVCYLVAVAEQVLSFRFHENLFTPRF